MITYQIAFFLGKNRDKYVLRVTAKQQKAYLRMDPEQKRLLGKYVLKGVADSFAKMAKIIEKAHSPKS